MSWPLVIPLPHGRLVIPEPGRYGVVVDTAIEEDPLRDALMAGARAALGAGAVGWVPAGGGLLANLPAWENILLATQWHAPASLPSLEARLAAWCGQLGYDKAAAGHLLSRLPAYLEDDERRLVGWLRQLLARPRLVVCEQGAIPSGTAGRALLGLLDEELAGAALLVVDGAVPVEFRTLLITNDEAKAS